MSPRTQVPAVRCSEQNRLASLRRYDLAAARGDRNLEDIVRTAAEVCDAPIAAVTLAGEDGQVFLAETGLGRRSAPLDGLFPQGFIEQDLLVVRDAALDPRFQGHSPLAVQDARFYAGVRMTTPEGLPLGALCVADRKPRDISPAQGRFLRSLGRQAMNVLELRRALQREQAQEREIAATRGRMESVLDTGMTAFFDWDLPTATIRGDRRLVEYYGFPQAIMTSGVPLADIFAAIHPDDRPVLEASVAGAMAVAADYSTQFRLLDQKGAERWVLVRGRCRRAENGLPLRYSGVVVDIGPAKQAEDALRNAQAQQHTVMQELAHRTKNTLAVVQSVTNQTLRSAASLDEATRSLNAWLPALARAVDALIRTSWTGAGIQDVARGIAPPATRAIWDGSPSPAPICTSGRSRHWPSPWRCMSWPRMR